MRLSFERFFAVWLLAQIVLPFTAPFPVCEIADFLGGASPHDASPAPVSPGDSQADAYAYAPPLATTAGRLKLVVVADLDASRIVHLPPPIVTFWHIAPPNGIILPHVQPGVLRV
jgi:hypothetical protein